MHTKNDRVFIGAVALALGLAASTLLYSINPNLFDISGLNEDLLILVWLFMSATIKIMMITGIREMRVNKTALILWAVIVTVALINPEPSQDVFNHWSSLFLVIVWPGVDLLDFVINNE